MPSKLTPNILILDIETRPALGYFWGLFDQNIGLNQIVDPGYPMMVGLKYMNAGKVEVIDEYSHGKAQMWGFVRDYLVDADAVVTYNGDRFDLTKINGQMLKYGLDPLPPLTSIDLLKTTKKFGLLSNKLDFACGYYEIGQKIKHAGFELWRGWMEKDPQAIKKMRTYCGHDVRLTERLYKAYRPYIATHPYLRMTLPDKTVWECPHCGNHTNGFQHRGYYRTKATRTRRIQCKRCGGWSKGKQERI